MLRNHEIRILSFKGQQKRLVTVATSPFKNESLRSLQVTIDNGSPYQRANYHYIRCNDSESDRERNLIRYQIQRIDYIRYYFTFTGRR